MYHRILLGLLLLMLIASCGTKDKKPAQNPPPPQLTQTGGSNPQKPNTDKPKEDPKSDQNSDDDGGHSDHEHDTDGGNNGGNHGDDDDDDDDDSLPDDGGDTLIATAASIQKHLITPTCTGCHGSNHAAAGLDYSDIKTHIQGSDNGDNPDTIGRFPRHGAGDAKTIIPGDPENSMFYSVLASGYMPLRAAQLTEEELQVIHTWISSLEVSRDPIDSDRH